MKYEVGSTKYEVEDRRRKTETKKTLTGRQGRPKTVWED